MAEAGRRILVTHGDTALGRRVGDRLRAEADVERVVCLASGRASAERLEGGVRVPFVPDPRPLATCVLEQEIDTVVQCGLGPDRPGRGGRSEAVDGVPTLCVASAIGFEGSPVRSWVVASSSAVYPCASHGPLLWREASVMPRAVAGPSAGLLEAEGYAADLARRRPHVNVALLRLQALLGPGADSPLAALLARDPVPSPLGFDPAIQLLHLDDAADPLAFAARRELAGVYNVASAGTIHWHEAVRVTGHRSLPLPVLAPGWLEPVLRRLGLPFLPAALLDMLRFGHAVDTARIERAGWIPGFDQRSLLATRGRIASSAPSPRRSAPPASPSGAGAADADGGAGAAEEAAPYPRERS